MDITAVGGRAFATHCLIKYRGRKSGKTFITPLCCADIGGEVVICGSKGGADHHPEWYLHIVASPEIEFQIATRSEEHTSELQSLMRISYAVICLKNNTHFSSLSLQLLLQHHLR